MGGTSKQTQTSQSTASQSPWDPAIPGLTQLTNAVSGQIGNAGLNGAQTGALNTLQNNANQGNPYAPQIGVLANDLFKGGNDYSGRVTGAFDTLNKNLGATANGDYLDPNKNPFFSQTTNTIGKDVFDRLSAMYAGSGRDPSGAGNFAQTAGRGIAEATAPIYANTYNTERANQLNAANTLYGGANTTTGLLSGLDQQNLANRQAGVGVAGQALDAGNYGANQTLAIEAQRLGIPLEQYAKIAGILGPLGQLGGTSNSSGVATGTNQMSGAQQFATIGAGLGGVGKFLWG